MPGALLLNIGVDLAHPLLQEQRIEESAGGALSLLAGFTEGQVVGMWEGFAFQYLKMCLTAFPSITFPAPPLASLAR